VDKISAILITRKPRKESRLKTYAKSAGIELIEQSFIKTVPIDGVALPASDWVFFSSPTAVRVFLSLYGKTALSKVQVGAVGPATATNLMKSGREVDFIGDPDLSPAQIGFEFSQKINAEKVLFPVSDISLRSVSSQVPPNNRIELILYKTELSASVAPKAGIICFTSPSNVRGYLLSNRPAKDAVLFCFGDATEDCLQNENLPDPIINLRSSSDERLIEGIIDLS